MIACKSIISLLVLTTSPKLLPDPSGKDRGDTWDFRRPSSITRMEWRCLAAVTSLRGQPDKRAAYLDALNELTFCRFVQSKYAQSLDSARTAHDVCVAVAGPTNKQLVSVAGNRGELACILGHYTEAEESYMIAWRAARVNGVDSPAARAKALLRLGRLYEGAGKYNFAVWCATQAAKAFKDLRNQPAELVQAYLMLARLATRLGDAETADLALQLCELHAASNPRVRLERARYYVEGGNNRAAHSILNELLNTDAESPTRDQEFLSAVRLLLSVVVTRNGDSDRGKFLLLAAVHTLARLRGPRDSEFIDAVTDYERLFPTDRAEVADHVAAIRTAARDEELKGPEYVLGQRP